MPSSLKASVLLYSYGNDSSAVSNESSIGTRLVALDVQCSNVICLMIKCLRAKVVDSHYRKKRLLQDLISQQD